MRLKYGIKTDLKRACEHNLDSSGL